MDGLFRGESVCGGNAYGSIYLYQKRQSNALNEFCKDIEKEKLKFFDAVSFVKERRIELYQNVIDEIGEDKAIIFKSHQLILEDPEFIHSILQLIDENKSAEFSIMKVSQGLIDKISSLEDEYLRQRWTDIDELAHELLYQLKGGKSTLNIQEGENIILLADDLTAAELMNLPSSIKGIVLRRGSFTSHMSILAQSKNIPTIIQTDIELKDKIDGMLAFIGAEKGIVYLNPTKDELLRLENQKNTFCEINQRMNKYNKTITDYMINFRDTNSASENMKVFLNLNQVEEENSSVNEVDGIGLLRTEFLFMDRDYPPKEDEQFLMYKNLLLKMKDKKVIIRTFDLGGDKIAKYMKSYKEANPVLGMRGVRIYKEETELFHTHLKAILRASAYGVVGIIVPMIISLDEIVWIKRRIKLIKEELDKEDILYGNVELGIMIETPAAVLMCKEFANEVDFFSIGTNDLIQYTLAIDRQSSYLSTEYNQYHPAILKMIHMVAEAGHQKEIPVGICGQLAGDIELTELFVNMGIDYLSVASNRIRGLKDKLAQLELSGK